MTDQAPAVGRIENASVERYSTTFVRNLPNKPVTRYRGSPPLVHRLTIAGRHYTFLALGSTPWVNPGDTVSFEYKTKGRYHNIRVASLIVRNADGQPVERGYRRGMRQDNDPTLIVDQ